MSAQGAQAQNPAFAGTRWSLVARAAADDTEVAGKALSELCAIYWYPLYAFVRRSGRDHHAAEDLTQGLFLRLIDKKGLAHADPEKGKFRTFLMSSMKNFMSNQHARATAQKRGGNAPHLSIDMARAEGRYDCEPIDSVTPQALYERAWALTTLQAALDDLRTEYESRGKNEVFEALHDHIIAGARPVPHAETADRLGMTEGNVKVALHRMRRRFGEFLRLQVAQTVESEEDIDAELRYLLQCFGNG